MLAHAQADDVQYVKHTKTDALQTCSGHPLTGATDCSAKFLNTGNAGWWLAALTRELGICRLPHAALTKASYICHEVQFTDMYT